MRDDTGRATCYCNFAAGLTSNLSQQAYWASANLSQGRFSLSPSGDRGKEEYGADSTAVGAAAAVNCYCFYSC